MPDRTCPRCLNTGTVWDFAHVLKIRCACQHVAVASPKVQAIHAMFEAAAHAPHRLDTEAFADYQTRVMEPLREAVRNAAAAETKAAA